MYQERPRSDLGKMPLLPMEQLTFLICDSKVGREHKLTPDAVIRILKVLVTGVMHYVVEGYRVKIPDLGIFGSYTRKSQIGNLKHQGGGPDKYTRVLKCTFLEFARRAVKTGFVFEPKQRAVMRKEEKKKDVPD